MPGELQLTAEVSSLIAEILRLRNDRYAMELARQIEFRIYVPIHDCEKTNFKKFALRMPQSHDRLRVFSGDNFRQNI
jgi:hypothetical protein